MQYMANESCAEKSKIDNVEHLGYTYGLILDQISEW